MKLYWLKVLVLKHIRIKETITSDSNNRVDKQLLKLVDMTVHFKETSN